jgi:hypothetical protein
MLLHVDHSAIQPEEICLLQRVFDQLCAEANVQTDSLEAETFGVSLIEMFQSGLRDEAMLLARARERHGNVPKRMA